MKSKLINKILILNYNLKSQEYELECRQILSNISYDEFTDLFKSLPIEKEPPLRLSAEKMKDNVFTRNKYLRFPARIITDDFIFSKVGDNEFTYKSNKLPDYFISFYRIETTEIGVDNIKEVFESGKKRRLDKPPITDKIVGVLIATLMISLIPIVNIIFISIMLFSNVLTNFIYFFLIWMLLISIFCIAYTSIFIRLN
ncbi:MAG: hypothetical protein KJI71_00330 [Patescibacteria group bacterium]|nr:hypothetical protein [Patescibacteria group bacterium]